jgi:hypothetical protein
MLRQCLDIFWHCFIALKTISYELLNVLKNILHSLDYFQTSLNVNVLEKCNTNTIHIFNINLMH